MQTSTPAFQLPTSQPVAQAPVASATPQVQSTQSSQTVTAKDGTVLDAGVVNLSKAIKQQESGGDYNKVGDAGTSHGAYQWQPGNFAKDAQQFGLDPNDFSPVNQDKVAYAQINAYKQAGYTPSQIASLWNSGKPDATDNVGVKTINGKPVNYDTPKYVQDVLGYFNQYKSESSAQTPTDQPQIQPQAPESPSVGGFLKNTVQSGANFVGNTANALLHPIQTVQNIGGAAVGAAQELGGQTNDNTAKFDALTNYFKERYGGVDKLLHTAYTDPVGLAADVSAALGVGGGIAGFASKGAEAAGLGQAAVEAGGADFIAGGEGAANLTRSTAGSGLAGALDTTSDIASKGSELTNPLTPIVKGAGYLLNKAGDISDIIKNPSSYTPEEIANSTRANVAQQVESALSEKQASLDEAGEAYEPFRNSAQFTEVDPDGLARLIEKNSGATVDENGVVQAGGKIIDPQQVKALQNLYDTFNPKFANGELTAAEFQDFRSYVNTKLAKFGREVTTDSTLKNVGSRMYGDVNSLYRKNFPGLEDMDNNFSSQLDELGDLRKGFIDKDGNLLESATNKIANSLGKGKDAQLARLEEIVPGITRKLQVMKTIEQMQKGSFTSSLVEKGGVVGGLLSGNIQGAALAFTSIILSKPEIAIPLLRAVGANTELVKAVMANLAKYTTLGVVQNNSQQTSQQNTGLPLNTDQNQPPVESAQIGSQPTNQNLSLSKPTINGFNTQGALAAGYTQQEINDFLAKR